MSEGDYTVADTNPTAIFPLWVPNTCCGNPFDDSLPTAGCYTIWYKQSGFIYAGMAGRRLTSEQIVTSRDNPQVRITGLKRSPQRPSTRSRPSDQFGVYVFDRFVLGQLSTEAIASVLAGERRSEQSDQSDRDRRLRRRPIDRGSPR